MRSVKSVLKKIRDKAGESIAETLIALLIASLALVMLASMISSTSSLIRTSKEKMDDYYTANAALENPSGGTAISVVISDTSDTTPYTSREETVSYKENTTFNNKPVLAYEAVS